MDLISKKTNRKTKKDKEITYLKTSRMKTGLRLNCACVHPCLAVPACCHVLQLSTNPDEMA